MKIKTADLIGPTLDFAVANREGEDVVAWYTTDREAYFVVLAYAFVDKERMTTYPDPEETYYPSFHWAHGGPIIQRENIDIMHVRQADLSVVWCATRDSGETEFVGPTPLIAAMRCYVASKLGDEVEIPDELT